MWSINQPNGFCWFNHGRKGRRLNFHHVCMSIIAEPNWMNEQQVKRVCALWNSHWIIVTGCRIGSVRFCQWFVCTLNVHQNRFRNEDLFWWCLPRWFYQGLLFCFIFFLRCQTHKTLKTTINTCTFAHIIKSTLLMGKFIAKKKRNIFDKCNQLNRKKKKMLLDFTLLCA